MAPYDLPAWLDLLDGELAPIRDLAVRLSADGFGIDPESGSLLISHRPKIGSEAYACVLFPGVPSETITRYQETQQSEIPALYKNVLLRLNGASLFRVDLCGLPASMLQSPPLLDRSVRQPFDLGSAQRHWRTKYKAHREQFHFGGGPHSHDQNTGYFLNGDGSVEALLKGGQRVWDWPSISAFLVDELSRAEPLFAS